MASVEAATYSNCPVEFIRVGDDGTCSLQEKAAEMLSQLKGRLAVVVIAGLRGTGKSFLLNRILGVQEGFETGTSVHPCTKGLWIWGRPIEISLNYHCIFIDSEGLGSNGDMQIFTLSILLSSCLIYNSIGAIDDIAMNDVRLVTNLAQHIHARAASNEPEAVAALAPYLPSLLWILRDFNSKVDVQTGMAVPGIEATREREYFENALKPVRGQEEQNRTRELLRDLFHEIDCATMVRPVHGEEDLRLVGRLPFDKLRPQFQTQIDDVTRKVYQSLAPKTIDGAPVSGSALVHLATEYCKALNSSSVPVIQSTWAHVIQGQLRKRMNEATQIYQAEMQHRVMPFLPLAEDRLRSLHKEAKATAMTLLEEPGLPESDPHFKEFRAELSWRLKQLYLRVRHQNSGDSLQECERVAKELCNEIGSRIQSKTSYRSMEELIADWERVQRLFVEKTHGPAQATVISSVVFPSMMESVSQFSVAQRHVRKAGHHERFCTIASLFSYFAGASEEALDRNPLHGRNSRS